MIEKTCSKCKETKDLSDFYSYGSSRTGLKAACKDCTRAAARVTARRYYLVNKEKVAARDRSYRLANPEKVAARLKAWNLANKEKVAAKGRLYYRANVEKIKAKDKAYYNANAEEIKACKRAQYCANAEEIKARNRAYYRANAKEIKAQKKAWGRANPDKIAAKWAKRKARKAGNGGSFTGEEWADLKAHFDYQCLCCGIAEPEINLTVDHVIPIVHGGASDIGNIQPLCRSCNSSKGAQTIDYRGAFA